MPKSYALKRELGLFDTTFIAIGIILGAGIYALIGTIAGYSGNGVWLAFLISAVVSAASGLSYAELSSMFPKAASEYEYVKHSFGKKLAIIVAILVTLTAITSSATVALGFSGYFSSLFNSPKLLSAVVLIIILSFISYWGIKISSRLNIIFTCIELFGLFLIIFFAAPFIGSVDYFEIPSFKGVFIGAALAFFAYIGFEDTVKLSEETKEPRKNIPRALVIAMIITTIVYILVAVAAVSVVPWQDLARSDSPLADVANKAFGSNASLLLAYIALFSTTNTCLLMMIGASRIMYGMAKQHALPSFFSIVHPRRRTPVFAVLVVMLITLAFISIKRIDYVASITDNLLFITFSVIY